MTRLRLVLFIRATGKTLEMPEIIHDWTFRDGRVVRRCVSEDDAQTQAAFAS